MQSDVTFENDLSDFRNIVDQSQSWLLGRRWGLRDARGASRYPRVADSTAVSNYRYIHPQSATNEILNADYESNL